MPKKNYIHATADEKYAKALMIYADSSKVLFYDEAAKTDKVAAADLKELFVKGVVISQNNKLYKPVCYTSAGLIACDGTTTFITFTGAAL